MEPRKLIATYARVSTARQEEEQTIQAQIILFKEEAERKNYEIVREYADDGWSGDTLARPDLDQLRADAKLGIFQAVLVYDPDRLARRYSYQELVMDELKEAGIELLFITVSAPKNSEEKILHGVRGLFAEYERAKITERFRIGKLRKIKEGHILTTEALYGYTYFKKQDGKHGYYEINKEEARVIKMVFSWVAEEGLTIRKVIRRLQDMAIRPRKSKRGVWSTSTLTTLLRHRGYIGEAHYGKSYAVVPEHPLKVEKYKKMRKSSRRVRPQSEWHIIPIPAIIDKVVFERVQGRLTTNFQQSIRNRKNQYLLANKIQCICGRTRTGEGPNRGKHLYYRCSDRVRCFPLPPACTEKGISARIADEVVWELVKSLMTSPDLLKKQITNWQYKLQHKVSGEDVDIEALQKESDKLTMQEERYNAAYVAGVFTLEKLKEYLQPIRERLNAIVAQTAKHKAAQRESILPAVPTDEQIVRFAEKARELMNNSDYAFRRTIILCTIEKVIGTKQHLDVRGHIPIDPNVEFFPNHRHGQDSVRQKFGTTDTIIPFELKIDIPPPLQRGIDYGFRSPKKTGILIINGKK